MCCIFGKRSLVIGACALTASCSKHYRAEGVVLQVDRQNQSLTISHRAIRGYMEGMAMPFEVRDEGELRDLAPGARVTFRLEVGRKRTVVSGIRRESTGIGDVPVPAQQAKLRVGAEVPDFALRDERGRAVHLSEFRGQPVVLDFIYTRCPLPDVCPRLSANMARLQKRFAGRAALLSITIDPEFDTPEVLGAYARRWQANPAQWHFLTGSPEQIREVAGRFGLVYWAEEGLITHTAVTAVIDARGKLTALLEGSSFTSRQLLDLVTVTAGPASPPPAPGPENSPAR